MYSAGAETGIYRGAGHHLTATNMAMKMKLSLVNRHGKKMFDYQPTQLQWWITGFNVQEQGEDWSTLISTVTIDFSNHKELLDGLKESPKSKKWKYKKFEATFRWEGS